MSISSITSGSSWQYSTASTTDSKPAGLLETAAKALGMTTDAVSSALASGSSLASLAVTSGVSEDDLVSALMADAPDDLKQSSNLQEMTTKLVETEGLQAPQGGPQGPPPGGQPPSGLKGGEMTESQTRTLDQLSTLLDTDADTLTDALTSGTSLSDLAQKKGVSYDQLASVLQSEFQSGYLIDTSL
jgi:lambda repressor-like predicted transcriptional regulator